MIKNNKLEMGHHNAIKIGKAYYKISARYNLENDSYLIDVIHEDGRKLELSRVRTFNKGYDIYKSVYSQDLKSGFGSEMFCVVEFRELVTEKTFRVKAHLTLDVSINKNRKDYKADLKTELSVGNSGYLFGKSKTVNEKKKELEYNIWVIDQNLDGSFNEKDIVYIRPKKIFWSETQARLGQSIHLYPKDQKLYQMSLNFNPETQEYTLITKNVDEKPEINTNGLIIPDPKLAQAISEVTGKTFAAIKPEDLAQITSLQLEDKGITNLSGIENCVNLKKLVLSYNRINDIGPLSGLKKLTSLYLESNQIKDIQALEGLSELKMLLLRDNKITNIDVLLQFPKLNLVNIELNPVNLTSGSQGRKVAEALESKGCMVLGYDSKNTKKPKATLAPKVNQPSASEQIAKTDLLSEQIKADMNKLYQSGLFRIPDEELESKIRAHQYDALIKYLRYVKGFSGNLQQENEKFKAGVMSWLTNVDIQANLAEYTAICDAYIAKMKAKKMNTTAVTEYISHNLERLKKGPQLKQVSDTQFHLEDGTEQKNSVSRFVLKVPDSVNRIEFSVARPEEIKNINDQADSLIRVLESLAANPENRNWSYLRDAFEMDPNQVFVSESDEGKFYEQLQRLVRNVENSVREFKVASVFIGDINNYVSKDIVIEYQIKELEKKIGKLSPAAVRSIKESYLRITGNTFPQISRVTLEDGSVRTDHEEIYITTANGSIGEIYILLNNIYIYLPHEAFLFYPN